jgi:RNA polymerase sigma-70 factor (ECF subfamily)
MRTEQFERLYEQHAQPLFGFLVYRTGDRALAEDLLADAFEKAFRARRRFDPRKASEKTWLYSIALNCLRDHARRDAVRDRAVERTPVRVGDDAYSALERVESRDDLTRALDSLTEEESEVIALRYGSDLTVPEIARVMKEKLTTIEGRVYRGLRKLRDELDAP